LPFSSALCQPVWRRPWCSSTFDLEKLTALVQAYHRRRYRLAHPQPLPAFDLSAAGHEIHDIVDGELLSERLRGGEDQLSGDLDALDDVLWRLHMWDWSRRRRQCGKQSP
jgi:hypothetical protein